MALPLGSIAAGDTLAKSAIDCDRFWQQQLYPFTWSGRWTDENGVEHRENR